MAHGHHHHHAGTCGDEAHADDHHDHHGHDHNHDHDGPDRGEEFSLYQHIDLDKIRCLNEAEPDMAKGIIKPWHDRLDDTRFLESDADEQLIIFIPFSGQVKLKSLALRCDPDDTAPAELRAFINTDTLDFDSAETTTPAQQWDLIAPADLVSVQDESQGVVTYPMKPAKFRAVRSLTLYIPRNFGDDVTRIRYLGLQGEHTAVSRDPIITVYEAAANPADHQKITGTDPMSAGHRTV